MTEQREILVVEDEAIVAADIEMKLRRLGYAVAAVATSGEMAIQKAEEFHPSLALMDIHLDGQMDGIEAAKTLWNRFGTPVIFLTAYADGGTLDRAKLAHPYGFIVKPFSERDLHVSIEIGLGGRQAEARRGENEPEGFTEVVEQMRQRRDHLAAAIEALESLTGRSGERKRGRPKGSKNKVKLL
jgi:CheY-like chemotaxis protein